MPNETICLKSAFTDYYKFFNNTVNNANRQVHGVIFIHFFNADMQFQNL